jgi:hypothetical protein
MTLSCRCSGVRLGGDEGGCRVAAEDAGVSRVRDAPQSEQKFEGAWLECPHVPQTRDRCAPQLTQNLLPSGVSALQNGQSIDAPHGAEKSEAQYDRSMLCTTVAEQGWARDCCQVSRASSSNRRPIHNVAPGISDCSSTRAVHILSITQSWERRFLERPGAGPQQSDRFAIIVARAHSWTRMKAFSSST